MKIVLTQFAIDRHFDPENQTGTYIPQTTNKFEKDL